MLLRLCRFWGQTKYHMNICERFKSFMRDVKNNHLIFFPLQLYGKTIRKGTDRYLENHIERQNVWPKLL